MKSSGGMTEKNTLPKRTRQKTKTSTPSNRNGLSAATQDKQSEVRIEGAGHPGGKASREDREGGIRRSKTVQGGGEEKGLCPTRRKDTPRFWRSFRGNKLRWGGKREKTHNRRRYEIMPNQGRGGSDIAEKKKTK